MQFVFEKESLVVSISDNKLFLIILVVTKPMKTKIFISLIVFFAPLAAYAQSFSEVSPSGDLLNYEIVDGYAVVTGRSDSISSASPYIDLEIPMTVSCDGAALTVREIGAEAFASDKKLASVIFPPTLKRIGYRAFAACYSLGTVEIPQTVTMIDENAFFMVANVDYQGSATGAPWGAAFCNAYNADGWCYADSTMRHLVHAACSTTDIAYPATVDTISPRAFVGTMVEEISVDGRDPMLANLNFAYCQNLRRVYYNLAYPEPRIFADCPVLEELTLGSSVRNIPTDMCIDCPSLRNIAIPNSVQQIGISAFEGCTSLEKVFVGDSVTIIGSWAFRGCTRLCTIHFGSRVSVIGSKSFDGCDSLREVVLPQSITQISNAFAQCPNIEMLACMSYSPPNGVSSPFASCRPDIPVCVPCGRGYTYSVNWPTFSNFIYMPFVVRVKSEDETHGTVEMTDTSSCDEHVSVVSAHAASGYVFDHWSDGSTDNPYVVQPGDGETLLLTAHFKSTNEIGAPPVHDPMRVYARNGAVVVENCNGAVSVYDIRGRLIHTMVSSQGSITMPVPATGVYIVKPANAQARKCVVVK